MSCATFVAVVLVALLAPRDGAAQAPAAPDPTVLAGRILADGRFQGGLPECTHCADGGDGGPRRGGWIDPARQGPHPPSDGVRPARRLPGPGSGGGLAVLGWSAALVTTLVALGGLAGLWRARGDDVRVEAGEASPDKRRTPRPDRDLREEVARLAAAGRFVEALHLLLQHVLGRLAAREQVALPASLTAREARRHLPLTAAERPAFDELLATVERTHFGGRDATGDDYHRCQTRVRALLGEDGRA